jgi:hypothetical protein
MIKRLSIVAFFTGTAYIFTIFSLKYLSATTSAFSLKSIGEIDSLVNFIVSVVAAGMLLSAVRNIAISADWKKEFLNAQRARFTLGLIIALFGFLSFTNINYILFFFAPLVALNGDYALYGRSKPVTASILAFIKISFPYLVVVFTLWFKPEWLLFSFIASTTLVYLVTGFFISRKLGTPYLIMPSWKSLNIYVHSLSMGVVSFSYYFIGLGLIWLAAFFYQDVAIAAAFLGIKLYTIFKGVLRMLNQSFFREMTDEAVRLKVDYLAMFAGTIFLAATVLFQEAFISVFFNKGSVLQSTSLVLLGCTGFLIAPFISLHTSVLLERKDRLFSRLSLLGIVVAASACMISSFIFNGANSILFSLLLGEFVIVAGLITICNKKNLFLPRLAFFRRNLPLLVIPIGSRILFGDNTYSFIGSLCVYGVLFLTSNWKSFILHKQEKEMRLYES